MAGRKTNSSNKKTLTTQQSVNAAIWSICNIMRRSNCAGALQYVPELTWMLFLRILDEREAREAEEAEAVGAAYTPSLTSPYRWCDWAAPYDDSLFTVVKTNMVFFTKGQTTEKIWYYDLSDIKVGKKSPLIRSHFDEFFRLLPTRADSNHSWTVTRQEIEARGYDPKVVNPHAKNDEDTRTPEELLDLIETKGREVAEALAALRIRPSPRVEVTSVRNDPPLHG